MKKYLVAALVACLGILSVNAQVDKTIEVSQCELHRIDQFVEQLKQGTL